MRILASVSSAMQLIEKLQKSRHISAGRTVKNSKKLKGLPYT